MRRMVVIPIKTPLGAMRWLSLFGASLFLCMVSDWALAGQAQRAEGPFFSAPRH